MHPRSRAAAPCGGTPARRKSLPWLRGAADAGAVGWEGPGSVWPAGAGPLTRRGELPTPRAATSSSSWTRGVGADSVPAHVRRGMSPPPRSRWPDPTLLPQWNTLASRAVEQKAACGPEAVCAAPSPAGQAWKHGGFAVCGASPSPRKPWRSSHAAVRGGNRGINSRRGEARRAHRSPAGREACQLDFRVSLRPGNRAVVISEASPGGAVSRLRRQAFLCLGVGVGAI